MGDVTTYATPQPGTARLLAVCAHCGQEIELANTTEHEPWRHTHNGRVICRHGGPRASRRARNAPFRPRHRPRARLSGLPLGDASCARMVHRHHRARRRAVDAPGSHHTRPVAFARLGATGRVLSLIL